MTAHWGIPDPAEATGSDDDIAKAFRDAYLAMQRRIELFTALPMDKLDRMSLHTKLRDIGNT